jgi:hypothetical protein
MSAYQAYVEIFIGFVIELKAGLDGEMIVELILFLFFILQPANVQSELSPPLAKMLNQELYTI